MDKGTLWMGWMMLGIAIALFVLSLAIFVWGLDMVFPGKRFPSDTDTPCFLAFLVMGIIFLTLGVVYRDMAVHPEIFENQNVEKSKHLAKREEWERIKQRVKELESGKERSSGGSSEGESGEASGGPRERSSEEGSEKSSEGESGESNEGSKEREDRKKWGKKENWDEGDAIDESE